MDIVNVLKREERDMSKFVKMLVVLFCIGCFGCITMDSNTSRPKPKPTASVGAPPPQSDFFEKKSAFVSDVPADDIVIRILGSKGWSILNMKKGYLNEEKRGMGGNWMTVDEWGSLYKNWGGIVNMVTEKQKEADKKNK